MALRQVDLLRASADDGHVTAGDPSEASTAGRVGTVGGSAPRYCGLGDDDGFGAHNALGAHTVSGAG